MFESFSNIKIKVNSHIPKNKHPFDFGVERRIENNESIIHISIEYKKYFPIILLREAYRLFIPTYFQNFIQFQFLIYMMIEVELEKLPISNDWKKFIRSYDTYNFYFTNNYDSLLKFLKLEDPDSSESIISFFFNYIRTLELKPIDDDIFDKLGLQFLKRMKKILKQDDILETIRILKYIFYKVKNYKALLDYQEYFKEMKQNGEIRTDLSLRSFSQNVRILNQRSFCAPTYQVDWNTLDLSFFISYFHFEPSIRWAQINDLLENMPFFLYPRISVIGLTTAVFGYFVIPNSYVNDLKRYFINLKQRGYLKDGSIYRIEFFRNFLNLNYLKEFFGEGKFVTPNSKHYNNELELKFSLNYSDKTIFKNLSLLDFLLLDRVRHFSITGFGFERRTATLTQLKTDLLNEIFHQKKVVRKLRTQLDIIRKSEKIRTEFLNLLRRNQDLGFFLINKRISNVLKILRIIPKLKKEIFKINTIEDLKSILQRDKNFGTFDEKLVVNDIEALKLIYKDVLSLYTKNYDTFNEKLSHLTLFYEFLENCKEMKIFNPRSIQNIIKEIELSTEIYQKKEEKLDTIYDDSRVRQISSQRIENKLEKFSSSDPPVIHPMLLGSIPAFTVARQYINVILRYSQEVYEKLEEFCTLFPSNIIHIITDVFNSSKFIYCELSIPNLSNKERTTFLSILYSQFFSEIIVCNRFLNPGIFSSFTRKDFYDFISKEFLYKRSLFEEFNKYSSNLLGSMIPSSTMKEFSSFSNIWESKYKLGEFSDLINTKRYIERSSLDLSQLSQLEDFNLKIDKFLLNDEFNKMKNKKFYQNYIKRIKVLPILNKFGLDRYFLYIQPIDANDVDYRLLLANNFQSIKITSLSPKFIGFFISYIFPRNNPKSLISYVNWMTSSKKNISEYILFTKKTELRYTNFYQNLDPHRWIGDISKFESYAYKVLFDSKYNPTKLNAKKAQLYEPGEFLSPNSKEFRDLLQIYGKKSKNLKKFINTKLGGKIEPILKSLIRKKLIYIYPKFKNLMLHEHIKIIVPNLNKNQIEILIDIFCFFNVVKICEIKGEYYIHNSNEKQVFESGLSIKIWFPDTEISLYIDLFNKIFEILGIKHWFIITELVDGTPFLKSILHDFEYDKFNPFKNLIWNNTEKQWKNWKLIGKNFVFNYPPFKNDE